MHAIHYPYAGGIAMISELVHQASDVLRARAAFLSGDERPSAVRPEILASSVHRNSVYCATSVPRAAHGCTPWLSLLRMHRGGEREENAAGAAGQPGGSART